jgi:hypothetical protein
MTSSNIYTKASAIRAELLDLYREIEVSVHISIDQVEYLANG